MLRTTYKPRGKTAEILDRAYELVKSVPYRVSSRWLFYRLLQEGFYATKADYSDKFLKATSAARHACYKDWRPDTLMDDTRGSIERGVGFQTQEDWVEAVSKAKARLDKWFTQDFYVECWYEARAMTDQFAYYTKNVTLRPMGGQPSIEYKWRTAKELEKAARKYGHPIVVLYFGDLDPAGETIGNVVLRDVSEWCNVKFRFVKCGLTAEQVAKYNVPENIEHPNAYQWEALSDEGAKEIINSCLNKYLRHDAFSVVEDEEKEVSEWLSERLDGLEKEWRTK